MQENRDTGKVHLGLRIIAALVRAKEGLSVAMDEERRATSLGLTVLVNAKVATVTAAMILRPRWTFPVSLFSCIDT